jgi:hypothetical protein
MYIAQRLRHFFSVLTAWAPLGVLQSPLSLAYGPRFIFLELEVFLLQFSIELTLMSIDFFAKFLNVFTFIVLHGPLERQLS